MRTVGVLDRFETLLTHVLAERRAELGLPLTAEPDEPRVADGGHLAGGGAVLNELVGALRRPLVERDADRPGEARLLPLPDVFARGEQHTGRRRVGRAHRRTRRAVGVGLDQVEHVLAVDVLEVVDDQRQVARCGERHADG